jgi:hypothetical protein
MDHAESADVHGLSGTPGGLRHASLESRVAAWNTPAQNRASDPTYTSPAYTNLKPKPYLRFRTL